MAALTVLSTESMGMPLEKKDLNADVLSKNAIVKKIEDLTIRRRITVTLGKVILARTAILQDVTTARIKGLIIKRSRFVTSEKAAGKQLLFFHRFVLDLTHVR